jgi:hypothetical protein
VTRAQACVLVRFSVCTMADVDEIAFYPQVARLGYDSAWVADSQMLFSDCYAVLALAAQRTTRLRPLARQGLNGRSR